jgi:hypothetical protein
MFSRLGEVSILIEMADELSQECQARGQSSILKIFHQLIRIHDAPSQSFAQLMRIAELRFHLVCADPGVRIL